MPALADTVRHVMTALSFPQYCPSCNAAWTGGIGYICPECWRELKPAGRGIWHADRTLRKCVIVSFSYADIAHDLVHRMKFLGRSDIAGQFGKLGARKCRRRLSESGIDVVIPVPLHPGRIRERGYDQNRVIADEVARELDISVRTDVIKRIRNTPPQSRLSDKRRLSNLSGAIVPNVNSVSSSKLNILLVDDVIHTGATIKCCMGALAELGLTRVLVLAICG